MNVLKVTDSVNSIIYGAFPNLNGNLKAIKTPCFRDLHFGAKSFNLTKHKTHQCLRNKIKNVFLTKFSLTIPSLAAKNAKTCLTKCCSSGYKKNKLKGTQHIYSTFNFAQSVKSLDKSTSSTVQNEAIKKARHEIIIQVKKTGLYRQPFCKIPKYRDTELVRLRIVQDYP